MVAKYMPLYQIVPLVIPSILIDVPLPTDTIPQQSGTDLAYINTLAERVGYTFYLQPGPIPGMSMAYWGPKLQMAIPFLPTPTPLAIDWDGRSNVESLQFSFDGFKKTQFVVLVKIDDVPVPIPIPVPDVTPLSPPLGQKDPIPLKVTPLVGLSGYTPDPGGGDRAGQGGRCRQHDQRPGHARRAALRVDPDRADGRAGTGRRDHLRRRVLRLERHAHDQAGLLQAELHAGAQPPDRRERAGSGDYGLGQQLPAFSGAAGQAAVPAARPGPRPPRSPRPAGPVVPATSGASSAAALPASPAS